MIREQLGAPARTRRAGRIVPCVAKTPRGHERIELELLDEGQGPLVVLCHGFPSSPSPGAISCPRSRQRAFASLPRTSAVTVQARCRPRSRPMTWCPCAATCAACSTRWSRSTRSSSATTGGANLVWHLAVLPPALCAPWPASASFRPPRARPASSIMRRQLGRRFLHRLVSTARRGGRGAGPRRAPNTAARSRGRHGGPLKRTAPRPARRGFPRTSSPSTSRPSSERGSRAV